MITPSDFKTGLKRIQQHVKLQAEQPRTFTLSVKKRFNGISLLDLYHQSFPHVDRSFWVEKIETGNLRVDEKKTTPDQLLKAGQITSHSISPKSEPPVDWNLSLILATENFWVINKPSPLPVHAGGRYLYNTLTNGLKIAFPNRSFHLVNRLDANTTGIVLVALNKVAATHLGKQFEHREVSKTYLALVEGTPTKTEFENSASISKNKTAAGGRELTSGNESLTLFKVLSSKGNRSLLQVKPHSGHTNQIRLHLAGLNHPIQGDLGYKNPEYFKSHPLTYPTDSLFLHAWKLKFWDPFDHSEIKVISAPNKKWEDYL